MSSLVFALFLAALAVLIFSMIITRPTQADIVYDYDCSNGAHLKEANCR